jgi:ApbE superfamily uncharacterized protein (UPF0280 family)
MLGISVAGGVLRLRPQRTMPSIITMPTPGMSPSCTLSSRPGAGECWARSIKTKSASRPTSISPQLSLRIFAVLPVAKQNTNSAGILASDDSIATMRSIIIDAHGVADAVGAAHERAWVRFSRILDELVSELNMLRSPVGRDCQLRGPIARSMWDACRPFSRGFITPMAAVAGAVAQELVACYAASGVARAWVNNGGDIALHLEPSQSVRIGLYADIGQLDAHDIRSGISGDMRTDGRFEVHSVMPVRGVATSGWRGRSFSLGIADSVTVLARNAAEADAAATVIANAVNINDARIARRPACDVKDDSDLGATVVTVRVPELEPELIASALRAGLKRANELRAAGLIWSAVLVCQNQIVTSSNAATGILSYRDENTSKDKQVGSVFA